MAAIILVRSWPARPTKGSPCRSSSSPGPSPMNMSGPRDCRRQKRHVPPCGQMGAFHAERWPVRRDARVARLWPSLRLRRTTPERVGMRGWRYGVGFEVALLFAQASPGTAGPGFLPDDGYSTEGEATSVCREQPPACQLRGTGQRTSRTPSCSCRKCT